MRVAGERCKLVTSASPRGICVVLALFPASSNPYAGASFGVFLRLYHCDGDKEHSAR